MAGNEERIYRSELDRHEIPADQLDVVRIRLKPDVPLYSDRPITSVQDAVNLIADEIKDYDREVFCVLNLNTKGVPMSMNVTTKSMAENMSMNLVSMGSISETSVHPREVMKSAILSSASSILFFHNHPSSGDPAPSQEDIDTTRRLVEASNLMGIKPLDHIVVGKDGEYFSFKENDLVFNEPGYQRWNAAEETADYVADGKSSTEAGVRIGRAKKQSFREKVAEAFVQSLQENPREWTKNWASNETGRPVNMGSGRAYRGLNMAYLKFIENIREFHDPRWLTFKQASDAGYAIPKGTKMTPVEYFFMYDNLEKKTIPWSRYNALSEEERNQRVNTASGKLAEPGVGGTAIKARYELRHRDHYVFNASQLEGVPEYEYERTVNDIAPSAVVDAVAAGMGVPIEHKEQDRAFYSPSLDRITLPLRSQFFSDYDYQCTALHELGHATGHESRLGRDIQNHFGSPEYAYEELIAEITSCYMGEYVSQPMSDADMDNHLAYVQEWIKAIQEDDGYLFRAIREAEKAADYMIEKGDLEHLKEAGLLNEQQTDTAVLPARSAVAEPQTAYYNSLPAEQRPAYRIALYTTDFTPAEMEALRGPDAIKAEKSTMQVLEYLPTESAARKALKEYQSTASYQNLLENGEIPFSQIAAEYLQYDSEGDLICRELIDYTPKPIAFDLRSRSMEMYEDAGRYYVQFHSDADMIGATFCIDEPARVFVTGFRPYFMSVIDSDLERLLRRESGTQRAYRDALDDYIRGAQAVLDETLPAGWRLSYRERAQTRDYFEHEIRQSIGIGKREEAFIQTCFQDVLAARGYAFRTMQDAESHFREEAQTKWQDKMRDTLVSARGKLIYAGDEI